MIKPKIGTCIEGCKNVPLIAGRCHIHYWEHRYKANAEKTSNQAEKAVKHYSIPDKSHKQIERDLKYAKIRKLWILDHRQCDGKLKGCTHFATQVHHMQGRSGALLFDTSKWKALCWNCHELITEDSGMAINLGLSLKRNT